MTIDHDRSLGTPLSVWGGLVCVLLIAGAIGIVWEFAPLNQFIFSKPSQIALYVYHQHASIWLDIKATVWHVSFGLLIGSPLGLLFGSYLAMYRRWLTTITPLLGFTVALPKLALAIFLSQVLGNSELSLIVFNVWMAFLWHFIGAYRGANALLEGGTGRVSVDTARAVTLYLPGRHQRYVRYVLPMTLQDIWVTTMLASAAVWTMQIFTELVYQFELPGLGMETFNSGEYTYNAEAFIVSSLLLAIFSLVTWVIVHQLSRWYQQWLET